MDRKQARVLLSFPDDVARSVLTDFEYQIFCILREVAKEKFGNVDESDVNKSKIVTSGDK